MKKSLIGISLIVVLIVGVVSINLVSKKGQEKEQVEKQNLKIENNIGNIEGKNIISTSSVTDKLISEDFSTLVKHSDAVIKGKVLSVKYEAIQGNAWTNVTIQVDDVFKGDIKTGDKIEVYHLGGYISLDEHIQYYNDEERFSDLTKSVRSNTVLKEVVDGEEDFINKDEELVLCLVKTSDNSPLPKDSYERLYASGMLKEKNSKFVQVYGENDTKYSIEKNNIKSIKKLEEK